MHVSSFYSYKGGVGRTVCLLNVAWELALRGKRVALMDLDLEAPGLHRAHLVRGAGAAVKWEPVGPREGLLHAFDNWMKRAGAEQETSQPFDLGLVIELGPYKNIALLPAGRKDNEQDIDIDYQTLLHRFNWRTFYKNPYNGRNFLEKVLEFLGEHFEHLLVDARTGLTDVQYVTTIHLPDLVILVTNLTEQSLRGTREQIQRIDKINNECRRKKGSDHRRLTLEHTPIEMLVVASPVPLGEWAIRSERLDHAANLLDRSVDFVVDHLPILACHEDKQILDQKRPRPWSEDPGRTGPAATFSAIADAVLQRAAASAENLIEAGERMFRAGRWREASAFFDAAAEKEKHAGRDTLTTSSRAHAGGALAQLQGLEPENVERELQQGAWSGSHLAGRVAQLAEVWLAVSWSYVLSERYDKAANAAHKATELLKDKKDHDLQRIQAFAWYVEGDARAELGGLDEACTCLGTADRIYRMLPGVYAEQAMVLGRLATTLALRGKPADAEEKLREAEKQLRRVFPGGTEDRGKRLWAGLREAEGEIRFASGDLAGAAEVFAQIEKTLRPVDTVGHVHAVSRRYHLHARYGVEPPESVEFEVTISETPDRPESLPDRANDLRVPQVAASVLLDQAMQGISTLNEADFNALLDSAMKVGKDADPYRARMPNIDLRVQIVKAWHALVVDGKQPDLEFLERDEETATEHYELRFEIALIRALTVHKKKIETSNWRRRTESACQAALKHRLWLWYDLLWIASGGPDSYERSAFDHKDTVRRILAPLGEESDWPGPLQDAFKRRYASLAVQEA